jgi:hypothetical protein
MTCEGFREQFSDYLSGEMEADEKKALTGHLAGCGACRIQFERMEAVWKKLGELPETDPSPALRSHFYAMLESEKQKAAKRRPFSARLGGLLALFWPRRPAFQLAFSLGCLLIGLFIGNRVHLTAYRNGEMAALRREITDMQQTISVSLMNQTSSTDRLLGIQYSAQIDQPRQPLLETLLNRLNTDPNVNVRLAAVDALYAFSDRPGIRTELIASLSQQTSPLVQISLIDLLVEIRERRSLEALRDLIHSQDADDTVKQHAQKRMKELI